MPRVYDNWERLVGATLRREQLWQLCHAPSREPSINSRSSDFSYLNSPLPTVPFGSWYNKQNPINRNGGFEVEKSQALAPEEIVVNGEPLSQEKLDILLSCPHPPKKLKPGHYWYDKAAGFWGKRGRKPSQIISPWLNVGGPIHLDASNGDTQILINCRRITKVEQRMLKFAGVPCWPDTHTHFWMDENGVYQYEGQSYRIGCLWNKVGMKLLCSALSLPFPPKSSNESSGVQSVPQQNGIQKLLLIGCNGSGTSTIFKQAVEILKPYQEPSNVDIEHVTSCVRLSYMDFLLPESAYNYDDAGSRDLHASLVRHQLIRLQVKDFAESTVWLPMFEDVQIVLFCVSLSDYDQFSDDDDGNAVNKMLLSKMFFEKMVTHPAFNRIDFLLILNKFDLFEEKIEQVPLSQCDWFDDFRPVMSHYRSNNKNANLPSLGQLGFHYIASKFKRLCSALTSRKLYASLVNSLESESVDAALKYARAILKWDEERLNHGLSGYSSDSSDSGSLSD